MLLVGANRRPLLDFRSRFPLLAVHSQIRSFEPLSTISPFKIRKRLRQYALDALADVTGGIISWNAYGYDRGDLLCFHSVHVI